MAAPLANTFLTTDAAVNREELSNIVDMTERQKTPIYTMIGKSTAKSTNPGWAVEDMDPPGDNAQPEGREYDFNALDPADRFENHTQIFQKSGSISNTQQAVDNAGKVEQFARAKIVKGIELKRDVEYSIIGANPSVAGETRKSGGLLTWAETNTDRGPNGANGGYDPVTRLTTAPVESNDGATTPTITTRALTKAMVDKILRLGYESGADLRQAFMTPYQKEVFATFMSDANVAQLRSNVTSSRGATLLSDVEMYRGPNGMIYVIPNAVMALHPRARKNMLILDTSKLSWAWLRRISEVPNLANTGDKKPFVIDGEGTLKVANEKGIGVIADLTPA